jgi:hypothetical protein
VDATFVIDAWSDIHKPIARRNLEMCGWYSLDCRLSEGKPAELYATGLCERECGEGCAVMTRDYDVVVVVKRYAFLLFRGGRL